MLATMIGVEQDDSRLDDLSPDGLAEAYRINVAARAALQKAAPTGERDELALEVAVDRLDVEVDRYESGWSHANLNVIDSPLQAVRMMFDLMPTESETERETVAARLRAVPEALRGFAQSLRLGARAGHVSAARQVRKCADQCAVYSGTNGGPGFFGPFVSGIKGDGRLGAELQSAGEQAARAYADFGDFLREELLPQAPERDAVGRDRYAVGSRDFLGAVVDLDETYAWGWEEFLHIERELIAVAEKVAPGAGPAGAAAALDANPAYQISGQEALKAWMQRLSDEAVAELGRTHFDVPAPIARLECLVAPPGGPVGAYYTPPSDDLTRPGRMWWSVAADKADFGTWRELTVIYHEGVPGHHLQLATAVIERDKLNAFQRLLGGTSGHAEGWALYAELLMRDLGFLDDPGNLLGMLDGQLFRAARVIVDIGMHLELPIPAGTGFHEGERWTPELGLEFMLSRTLTDPDHVRDEIDRYLGWPGQAPAYKVGERIWLEGRAAARAQRGASFDLKEFHTKALRMGNMGLGPLARRLPLL